MTAAHAQTEQVFYTLPVERVVAGMSTGDGQDYLDAPTPDGNTGEPAMLWAHVYTPATDPVIDEYNRAAPETRGYPAGSRVTLAVFADTEIDGRSWPDAETGHGSR